MIPTGDYSHTLLLPGDESVAAELSNGSVVINMRGHDLPSYDHGDPNLAMRWLGRSDDRGSTWPPGQMHTLTNASSGKPMHFGGDCFGTMAAVPPVAADGTAASGGRQWVAAGEELLVMGAIHSNSRHGIGGWYSRRSRCYSKW